MSIFNRSKGEGLFWRAVEGRIASSPSLFMPAWEFVAIVPKDYDRGHKARYMIFRENNGDAHIIFTHPELRPLRYNIKKDIFERMEAADNDRWEWRQYYG